MQVEKTKENLEKCKCMKCPSYTTGCKIMSAPENLLKMMEGIDKVKHFEGMFCAFEKSHCIKEDKGCLCDGCEIHSQYDLDKNDYCIK